MKKVLSILLVLITLISPISLWGNAAEYNYEEPVETDRWKDPEFSTDHAYSIALVGDPQFINEGDVIQGTKKMEQIFGYIADTAEERKLAHVFVLGDITHTTYRNDSDLAFAHNSKPHTAEWENAQKSILQLSKAGVSYSLCRGNHDDYMIDDYFNIPAYTDQFQGVGGFFSDSESKYTSKRENKNKEGYVYWSAISGYHKDSIVNSYKTAEICGTKYLFITVDFNPTHNVMNWLDSILEEYSDHRAIITTHSYIGSRGTLLKENDGTMHDFGISPEQMWNQCFKNHPNILMIACGHVGATKPVFSVRRGSEGNVVREILVDPQKYDVHRDTDGSPISGIQDTGLVLYLNFSADGKTFTCDYYSTLLNKEMVGIDKTYSLYPFGKETEKEPATKAAVATASPSTYAPVQMSAANPVLVIVFVAVPVAAIAIGIMIFFIGKRKKK